MLRGGKIRFTDFEVNHAVSLGFQRTRPDQHFKSRLYSEPVHSVDNLHGSPLVASLLCDGLPAYFATIGAMNSSERPKNQHRNSTIGACTMNCKAEYPTRSRAFSRRMPSSGSIQKGFNRLGRASAAL